jgi:hypothetical protein
MKKQIRLLGVDDAPFSFDDRVVSVIGVVMRGGEYVEGVLRKEVKIDGTDATDICIEMIERTRHRKQLKVLMLDGVSLGGFNVVDIEKILSITNLPVITLTRDLPNFEHIEIALKQHFRDWEGRLAIMTSGQLHKVKTKHNPIYVKCAGINIDEAKEIINLSTIRGVIPEPIRIAHIIASGITRGESYGKA